MSWTEDDDNNLTAFMVEGLERCLEKGMQLPFIICAISPNGSAYVGRFSGPGESPETLTQHIEDAGFSLPMTIAILDQAGDAVRLGISSSGQRAWH
jgi:hypothetical protein